MEDNDNKPERKMGPPPMPPGFIRPASAASNRLPGGAAPAAPAAQPEIFYQSGATQQFQRDASAEESARMKAEKDKLEQVVGRRVNTHRNHYLRFDPNTLYSQLEAAEIEFDLSLGFTSRIGFRAGCALAHRTFDFGKNRPSRVFSIPQVFMDTVLDYLSPEAILKVLQSVLADVKTVQGCVFLVFHPETFLIDPRAWPLFQDILRICQKLGADLSGRLPRSSSPESKSVSQGLRRPCS